MPGQIPPLPWFPSLAQLAAWLDGFTGAAGLAELDLERDEVTVADNDWTLRLLWDDGQAGWVYAIEDDAAQVTVDAGLVQTAGDLAAGYLRLVTRMAAARPPDDALAIVAAPRRPPARVAGRRRPPHPRPRSR